MTTATLSPAGLAGSCLAPSSSFLGGRARIAAVRPAASVKAPRAVVVASLDKRADEVAQGARKMYEKIATPALSLALAATLMGGVVPDDAMAAKSSGRVGGRSFSGSAGKTRAAPRQQRNTTVNNVYVAPSVGFSPFGFSPFGFSPFGFSPFGFGFGFMSFSTILSLMAFGLVANFVLGAMSSVGESNNKKKDNDDFFD